MEATQSFGTFQRLCKELVTFLTRPVFAKPAPVRRRVTRPPQTAASTPAAKTVAAAAVAPSRIERVEAPKPMAIPQQVVPAAGQSVVVPAVETQVPEEKPMRTLAEVRADLARLREKSRERQAQQRSTLRHDANFPATDFMEFVPSVPEPGAAKQEDAGESFAPTAYLDFTVLKSR